MSMTREDAYRILECMAINLTWALPGAKEPMLDVLRQRLGAINIAQAALRPVSREQVEKVWRGEWMALDECSNEGVYCKRCKKKVYRIEYANEKMRSPFCPACGAAQTDEAVQMVMERLEALHENS